jgi:uncharacterized membrane protein (UPF0127 family)
MESVKRILISLVIVVACAITAFFLAGAYGAFFLPRTTPSIEGTSAPTVSINGHVIRVTVADTDESRMKGLGERASLAPDEGMLFLFPYSARHAIWMKDMRFAIDVAWLLADGTIIDMKTDLSPDTYPSAFAPRTPARSVLELPAGFLRTRGIEEGDRVEVRL